MSVEGLTPVPVATGKSLGLEANMQRHMKFDAETTFANTTTYSLLDLLDV